MMNFTKILLVFHCVFTLIWAFIGNYAYNNIFNSCNGNLARY